MTKEINNMCELQEYLEDFAANLVLIHRNTVCITCECNELARQIEVNLWADKPEYDEVLEYWWESPKGSFIGFDFVPQKAIKLNFEPDWSECIFDIEMVMS